MNLVFKVLCHTEPSGNRSLELDLQHIRKHSIKICFYFCSKLIFFSFLHTVGRQKLSLSRQSSDQSTTSRNIDVYSQRNTTTELVRKIEELVLNPQEKEEIVCKLTQHLNDLVSERSAVVYQRSQATINDSPPRSSPVAPPPVSPTSNIPHSNNPKPAAATGNNRPKSVSFAHAPGVSDPASSLHSPSSPALPTGTSAVLPPSSSSAFASGGTSLKRAMSLPESQLRLKHAIKPQRRNTMYNNRFSALESLSEDQQALL